MENFKNLVKNSTFFHILILISLTLCFSLFLSNHFFTILSDRGREFAIPEAILNGYVPYKDITLIYFPFAYYINALIYKLLNASINSLIISQTFLCVLFVIQFYLLSKEFINKLTSFLLSILIISSCIFVVNDLFSFITPYSYARTYGIMSFFTCVYTMIIGLKTNNTKYIYFSALTIGFCLCCKLEFLPLILFFLFGLSFYKRLSVIQYIKIFLVFLIFPLILLTILFVQNIPIHSIIDSIDFAFKFAKTDVMTTFLSFTGMYPYNFKFKYDIMINNVPYFILLTTLCFYGLMLYNKYSKLFILPIMTILICYSSYKPYSAEHYFMWLPIGMAIITLIYFKKFLKVDKCLLLLILAAILLSQREFFILSTNFYGSYSLPMLIISLCAFINAYIPYKIYNAKTMNVINYIILILICYYTHDIGLTWLNTQYPLETNKGKVYLTQEMGNLLEQCIDYINENIPQDATILVLPEGNILNFFTDRKVDFRCFMMDRLYYDAYGDELATKKIAETNSDYIILFDGKNINNFYNFYIYGGNNLVSSYIWDNYTEVKNINYMTETAKILKKNH